LVISSGIFDLITKLGRFFNLGNLSMYLKGFLRRRASARDASPARPLASLFERGCLESLSSSSSDSSSEDDGTSGSPGFPRVCVSSLEAGELSESWSSSGSSSLIFKLFLPETLCELLAVAMESSVNFWLRYLRSEVHWTMQVCQEDIDILQLVHSLIFFRVVFLGSFVLGNFSCQTIIARDLWSQLNFSHRLFLEHFFWFLFFFCWCWVLFLFILGVVTSDLRSSRERARSQVFAMALDLSWDRVDGIVGGYFWVSVEPPMLTMALIWRMLLLL